MPTIVASLLFPMHQATEPRTGFARCLRDLARAAVRVGLLLLLLSNGSEPCSGQSPESGLALDRLLYADAKEHLTDADPIVRGEAALVLAASGDRRAYPSILLIAKDRDDDASLRGILALGFLGAPGSEQFLAHLLDDRDLRTEPRGLAAAYALARLPQDQAASALARELSRLSESSYKRQREVLLALLSALLEREPDDQLLPLQRLFADASLKDPVARAALLTILGRIDGGADDRAIRTSLASRATELRLAAFSVLQSRTELEPTWAASAVRIVEHDPDASVRAQGLSLLTRLRHLPALDLAAKALRSKDAGEVAEATRTALLLGGAPMRCTLERQFEYLEVPAQTAMLSAFHGAISREFEDTCERVVRDASRPIDLRAAAALLLRENGDTAVGAALEALFREVEDPATLRLLADARSADGGTRELLDAITLPCANDAMGVQAARLAALLRTESPMASRRCIEWLQQTDLGRSRAVVLRAIRTSRLPIMPAHVRPFVPAVLLPLL